MSVSFKNPDGTINFDGDNYRRHFNPTGEKGGLVDVRATVGKNVTIDRDALVYGTGTLPAGSVVSVGTTFDGLAVYAFDASVDD